MMNTLLALGSRAAALACRMILLAACGLAAACAVLMGLRFPFAAVLLLGYLSWRRWRRPPPATAYGTACTASLAVQERAGLLGDEGLILGRCLADPPTRTQAVLGLPSPWTDSQMACRLFFAAWYSRRWLSERLIRVKSHVHLLTCSPTGGGKGVAVLKPNLLAYPGNCVVVDPGGDLFTTTAEHRRKKFSHRIIRLDVCELFGPGDTLNPLDPAFIDPQADDFVERCNDLADQIVIRQKDEKDPYWNESAQKNLKAFAAFVCAESDPAKRNLGTVRSLIASRAKYALALKVMQQMTGVYQGVIARLGASLTWHEGEEQASTMSVLDRHTSFLDSPAVRRCLASSSFDPAILRTGRATVYLILPHDRLATMSRVQRLFIGTIMRRSTQVMPNERNPVLWLLDEIAHIGHMQAIEDATTLMRSQGVRLWLFVQSIEQLKSCFGDKAQTVLDNCGTQQYFGTNSYGTAEEISKRIGDATLGVRSVNDSTSYSQATGGGPQSQGGNSSRSTAVTHSEIARRLWKPEEILTMSPDVALIFHKHLPVVPARLVRYFEAREFRCGGTARPRRLGLAAVVLAAFTLCASSLVCAAAFVFARSSPLPRLTRGPATRQAALVTASRRRAQAAARPARTVRRARQLPHKRRRPGPSGFLIKIQ